MDFIEPVFGNRCIQYMNGEEAKLRRQRYDYFMNSEFVSMYFPSFVEVSFCKSQEQENVQGTVSNIVIVKRNSVLLY